MLKKNNDLLASTNAILSLKWSENRLLDKFSEAYTFVSVDELVPRMDEGELICDGKVADSGMMGPLTGAWSSYKEPYSRRLRNTFISTCSEENLSSGIRHWNL